MIKVVKYENTYKSLWDEFIKNSKNGTFLFHRDYMEYHSDRFTDSSLLFFSEDDKLIGVLPANIRDNTLYSHAGLTYGGIISNNKMTTPVMLDLFESLKEYLKSNEIKKFRYKAVPHIYHNIPANEDLYALFVNDARLVRRDVASTIDRREKIKLSDQRRKAINKAIRNGLEVRESNDLATFMDIVKNLVTTKYGVNPTHTYGEMQLLRNKFPENIKLFSAFKDGFMYAGLIMYLCGNVVHAQYGMSTDEGKKIGALDIIYGSVLYDYCPEKRYFDFGTSTEQEGRYLNLGLINQKESFGARATVYDTYEVNL
ncbi:MAG: GNAT family N-acetyltransferase [Candidatus Melainabacteria bacterium GWF2_37_15]|nr:MAG: GNAT family N-acetyltransferase [Candidatus Melainabacteria bacterium GWF2_37_15]